MFLDIPRGEAIFLWGQSTIGQMAGILFLPPLAVVRAVPIGCHMTTFPPPLPHSSRPRENLPILPPIVEQPPRPDGRPPSEWTSNPITTSLYQHNHNLSQETDEYVEFEHNTQWRDQYYDATANSNQNSCIDTTNTHSNTKYVRATYRSLVHKTSYN